MQSPISVVADKPIRVVIVSGLSGSGKTTAIRALEDIGFFCIDNLPVVLLDQVLVLGERATIHDIAVGIDVRERAFLSEFERSVERVAAAGYDVQTLFLTTDDAVLIRRFKETRRRHPLQGDGTIASGITAERETLSAIRNAATVTMDTTDHNVHELRRRVQAAFRSAEPGPLHLRIESFGFKHGIPHEADYVFDVRFLQNPYFQADLRAKSGLDAEVADYVFSQPDAVEMRGHLARLIEFVAPRLRRDGRSSVTVAVGCTGGQHRSVALTEWLSVELRTHGWKTTSVHRDLGRS